MRKKNKILIILFSIIIFIFMEGLRLHYTIEAVRVSKKIMVQNTHNLNLQKDISCKKIKLIKKMDLNTIKKYAKEEMGMEISESINHVKIKKDVSK